MSLTKPERDQLELELEALEAQTEAKGELRDELDNRIAEIKALLAPVETPRKEIVEVSSGPLDSALDELFAEVDGDDNDDDGLDDDDDDDDDDDPDGGTSAPDPAEEKELQPAAVVRPAAGVPRQLTKKQAAAMHFGLRGLVVLVAFILPLLAVCLAWNSNNSKEKKSGQTPKVKFTSEVGDKEDSEPEPAAVKKVRPKTLEERLTENEDFGLGKGVDPRAVDPSFSLTGKGKPAKKVQASGSRSWYTY